MGERAKVILNEYSAKDLLMRDTLNLDKFYTTDLKMFIEVARKEIKRLNEELDRYKKITFICEKATIDYESDKTGDSDG